MSSADALFPGRKLRLCYWPATAKILDAERVSLEKHLAKLGEVKVETISALDAPEALPCDLLVIGAQKLPTDDFPKWLAGLRRRIQAQAGLWTPALILAEVPFSILADIMAEVTKDNWYFDVIATEHMASLPMRVANLLRIHDHLHELKRYARAVDDITLKVQILESQMRDLGGGPRHK